MFLANSQRGQQVATLILAVLLPAFLAFAYGFREVREAKLNSRPLDIRGLIVKNPTIDLGTVWSDHAATAIFTVDNQTQHDAQIMSVKSDCGCTVPSVSEAVIPRAKTFEIPVTYWPPEPLTENGGNFRRTIKVEISTETGTITIPLILVGFVAADSSLRIFPLKLNLGPMLPGQRCAALLHFKGQANVLAPIQDHVDLRPGQTEFVNTGQPVPGQTGRLDYKDVQLVVQVSAEQKIGPWSGKLRFAPEDTSQGLTVLLQGVISSYVIGSASSLLLSTDDSSTRGGSIEFHSIDGGPIVPISVNTELPLTYEFSQASNRSARADCTLSVRLKKEADFEGQGDVKVTFLCKNQSKEVVTIHIVGLHQTSAISDRSGIIRSNPSY